MIEAIREISHSEKDITSCVPDVVTWFEGATTLTKMFSKDTHYESYFEPPPGR